jgi:hypothetical protein
LAGGILARDSRVDALNRVDRFDGGVGPEHERRAGLLQAAPGIRAVEAVGAEAVGDPFLVARGEEGLDGGNGVECSEAGPVVWMQNLGVFDARTTKRGGGLVLGGLVRIQHEPVGPVADGVRADLKSFLYGGSHVRAKFFGGLKEEPPIPGIICVVIEKGGAAAAEGAVGKELDGLDPQAIIRAMVWAVLAEVVEGGAPSVDHGVDAEWKAIFVDKALESSHRVEANARVMETGESVRCGVP